MSFHRENIVWQSADGTWNRGFYQVIPAFNTGDDDYDPEWDDDYDFNRFEWVRTGLRSEDAADAAWEGANPGGYDTIAYGADTDATVRNLDHMAAEYAAAESKSRAAHPPRAYYF